MAKQSNEDMQRELLEVQLETAQISRDRAKADNEAYRQQEAARTNQNRQRQAGLAQEAANVEMLTRTCLHRQGGGPEDRYEGDGKSALVLSEIFFSNNFLIMCQRCPLAIQRPHPKRKSTKALFPGETAEQIKARIELYNADVTRYEQLLREAKSNKLRPMRGPTFEFRDEDGNLFQPEMK